MKQRIYIASKTKHAEKWIKLRDQGLNITSTWIDEAGPGKSSNLSDLCERCVREAYQCNLMIVYREDGDYLKGAFIEMGIALAAKVKVYLVGPVLPAGSVFTHHPNVYHFSNIEDALNLVNP